jgi:hypothetical protein
MPPRVLAGLALWVSLAALPAAHVGLSWRVWIAVAAPLGLLCVRRLAVAFVASMLPLLVIQPDLASPRATGTAGVLLQAGLVVTYLIVALWAASGIRPWRREAWDFGQALAVAAAWVMAAALSAPYLPSVSEALRESFPAGVGAASALLAAGCVALGAGLVLVYSAAPLEEASRRRP